MKTEVRMLIIQWLQSIQMTINLIIFSNTVHSIALRTVRYPRQVKKDITTDMQRIITEEIVQTQARSTLRSTQ
jgi:hypothetical protein